VIRCGLLCCFWHALREPNNDDLEFTEILYNIFHLLGGQDRMYVPSIDCISIIRTWHFAFDMTCDDVRHSRFIL